MRKKIIQSLLVPLIGLFMFSCDNAEKFPLSSIDTDFVVVGKLDFQRYKNLTVKHDNFMDDVITTSNINVIEDSVLWFVEPLDHDDYDACICYNLNTGESLALSASPGRAPYQMEGLTGFKIAGDSVYFYEGRNTVKTFNKQEIIRDVPMEERKFSVTTFPDSVWVSRMTKLPNGTVIATIRPPFEFEKNNVNGINKNSVVVWDHQAMKGYQTIDYASFDVKKRKRTEIPTNDLIKWTYAQGFIETRGNDLAVIASSDQFMLYTFDVTTGKVVNEKRYTPVQYSNEEFCFLSTNDMRQSILAMEANDSYIVCKVGGYFNAEDKEYEVYKEAIFVFDWNLNPIKRFDLPDLGPKGYFSISNDARSVYFNDYAAEEDEFFKLTLHKADLAL